MIHANLGEKDKAIDLLEQCYGKRVEELVLLRLLSTFWSPLEREPRYRELLRRIGIGDSSM